MSATDSAERGRGEPIDADFDEPAYRHGAPREGVSMGTALALSFAAALGGGAIGALAPRTPALAPLIDKAAPDELTQTRQVQAAAQRDLAEAKQQLAAIAASGGVSPVFAADYERLKADVAAAERKLANIDAGLKLLPNGPPETAALRNRIMALEALPKDPTKASPEQLARAVAGMQARVGELEARASKSLAFETASGIEPADLAARMMGLQNQTKALESKLSTTASQTDVAALTTDLKKLQADFADVAEGAKAATEAARAAYAVAAATDASRSSGPFPQAYASLQAVLPNDPNVIALATLSTKGAPTKQELRDKFDKIELEIVRAARAADAGGGFWGQLQAMFAQFIVVRRTGGGDAPNTIVERAKQKLSAEDLAGAVAEISRLKGAGAQVAAPWLKDAKLRLEIDQRLSAIRAELARKG
jgi:hypothetical protein